jgi:hypothetical protein
MNAHLQTLMQKEMSRKEFLATAGFGVASIFGMSTLLGLLGHKPPRAFQSSSGYGSNPYGR